MAITITHQSTTCYFPQILCRACMYEQFIYDGGVNFCTACKAPFPLGIETYAMIFDDIKERFDFFKREEA